MARVQLVLLACVQPRQSWWFGGMLRRTWTASSARHPTLATVLVGSTVMFLGDVTAQAIEGAPSWDLPRLAIGTVWQGAISAPLFNAWFRLLDRTVKTTGFKGALVKVFANQGTRCVWIGAMGAGQAQLACLVATNKQQLSLPCPSTLVIWPLAPRSKH